MNFKLGFGPMSGVIVDTMASYANSNETPLMIIASRNQVDSDGGYVMTTKELIDRIFPVKSNYIKICRDHCGPYFLDAEKNLGLRDAINATKRTIAGDIENNFDLIHIDTSRCENVYDVAEELIEFCLRLNPNIEFEFGTEDNVGISASIDTYKKDVKFASQFPNMKYVVAQTGSLTYEDRQYGTINSNIIRQLVDVANESNVKLKEHNADYLTPTLIRLRKKLGIHACNIAPQLGVLQTRTVLDLAEYYGIDTIHFRQDVIQSGRWKKWTKSEDDNIRVNIAGHYCFANDSYLKLEEVLFNHENIHEEISKSILNCLNLYYNNFY